MPTNLQICERWLAESMKPDPTKRKFVGRGEGNWKVSMHGFDVPGRCLHTGEHDDHLYSFGTHFQLARWVWTSKTKGFLLMNGDVATTGSGRVSGATSNHQWAIRQAGRNAGVAILTIPFSALTAGGIDLDSIRPIEIRPDRFDRWCEPYGGDMLAEVKGTLDRIKTESHIYRLSSEWKDVLAPDGARLVCDTWHGRHVGLDERGRIWELHTRHWLGDSVFEAKYRQDYRRRPTTEELVEHTNRQAQDALGWEAMWSHRVSPPPPPDPTPAPKWITFTRMVKGTFLSSFDYQETRPLYFFCQVPRKVTSVEDAILALAPRAVHAAHAQGRTVVRQGDIFAISVPEISREDLVNRGGTFVRYSSKLPPAHKYEALCAVLPEGYRMVWGELRCKFDRNGADRGWRGSTWYMQDEDRRAGRPWLSHPDPSSWVERNTAYPPGTKFVTKWRYYRDYRNDTPVVTGATLIGTAHTATEVCTCPDGTTYARGKMIHAPRLTNETREPDHIDQPLGDGDTWFLILRNTVPRQRTITWRGNGVPANR